MRRLIPIAETEFTNSCACRIPPLPALSPLVKGGLKSAIFNIPTPLPLE
jgi:hypothetical protein